MTGESDVTDKDEDGWEGNGPAEDRYMSAEQMLAQHVRDMGPELGREYSVLRHEVVWLHVKWALYRQLYGRSSARIEVLNQAAGHFFGVLHEVLLDDVVLTLARLLESPGILRSGKADTRRAASAHR